MLVMNTRKPSGGAKKLAAKGRTTGSAPSKSRTSGSSAPKKFADRKPFDKKFTDQKVTDRKVKPEEEGDVRKPHFPPKVRKGDPLPSFNEDEIAFAYFRWKMRFTHITF